MKASLQWMNEYVPMDMNRPAQELADELTQAGIPVEDEILPTWPPKVLGLQA